MQNKIRKLYKEELLLWKEATKKDYRIKEYEETVNLKSKKIDIKKLSVDKKKDNLKNYLENEKKNIQKKVDALQINNRTKRNLERGRLKPESVLDLHGYNKQDARQILFNFIKKNISLSHRCILVITGKKKGYMGSKSILRELLPKWLEEDNMSGMILSHCYASIKDGGDGARYILLRKKQKVLNEKDS